MRGDEGRRVRGDVLVFAGEALVGAAGRHCGGEGWVGWRLVVCEVGRVVRGGQ